MHNFLENKGNKQWQQHILKQNIWLYSKQSEKLCGYSLVTSIFIYLVPLKHLVPFLYMKIIMGVLSAIIISFRTPVSSDALNVEYRFEDDVEYCDVCEL